MQISERPLSDMVILDLSGKVTIGAGDVQLRDAVRTATSRGLTKVILNLQKVTAMDSSGVGEIVAAHTSARKRGGRLALINVPGKVLGVLQVQLLPKVLEIYDSEAEAIEALEG